MRNPPGVLSDGSEDQYVFLGCGPRTWSQDPPRATIEHRRHAECRLARFNAWNSRTREQSFLGYQRGVSLGFPTSKIDCVFKSVSSSG